MIAWTNFAILVVFVSAYAFVLAEAKYNLRKSKPVTVAAGLIWILVGLSFQQAGLSNELTNKLHHVLLEYAELFLFLLSTMSFVNIMVERKIFDLLRTKLLSTNLSQRNLFWATGSIAFFLSPIADNLTTALVMGTVVLTTLGQNNKLVTSALINIVVASNAGGTFSPFGDITTLLIWQKGIIPFGQFFVLFIPALINWLIPAAIISLTLSTEKCLQSKDKVQVRRGGFFISLLFLCTIVMTVCLEHFLHLPPFLGMMLGLSLLMLYGYFLKTTEAPPKGQLAAEQEPKGFDVFESLKNIEWDTLLFFYGIMLCIAGLNAVGYLQLFSTFFYNDLGASTANILIGILSALIDNIPLIFAVLSVPPHMDTGQWLLLTLTAGVGGSILSIGSAAGVALMGIGKGYYTFFSHLKWTWAILLGYAASIAMHFWLNQRFFIVAEN